jgi:hypothetical protein
MRLLRRRRKIAQLSERHAFASMPPHYANTILAIARDGGVVGAGLDALADAAAIKLVYEGGPRHLRVR